MGPNHYEALEPAPDAVATAETDELFAVLSNADRRFVLSHLAQRETPPALDHLAGALAEWSDDLSREDARIALHHVHLPKLEEAGLVTYDDTVELTDDADESLDLIDGV
jgi:DNA-binding transcriptional ArsR family regulator